MSAGSSLSPSVWHRSDLSHSFKPQDTVEVWSHLNVFHWHDFVVTRDSVTGIPDRNGSGRDAWREGVARADVDSIRLLHQRPAQSFVAAAVGVAVVAAILVVTFDSNIP